MSKRLAHHIKATNHASVAGNTGRDTRNSKLSTAPQAIEAQIGELNVEGRIKEIAGQIETLNADARVSEIKEGAASLIEKLNRLLESN